MKAQAEMVYSAPSREDHRESVVYGLVVSRQVYRGIVPNHSVQQGECLTRIAAQYGFLDYRTIYNDPGNAELRQKRPDPNMLFPGDVIFIPDKAQKQVPAETTKVHQFRIPGSQRFLRIVVEDLDGKKVVAKPFALEIEGVITQ